MFATSGSLFPHNLWLASLALAVALPPFLLAGWRGRWSAWVLALGGVGLLLFGVVAWGDLAFFLERCREGPFPDPYLARLPS